MDNQRSHGYGLYYQQSSRGETCKKVNTWSRDQGLFLHVWHMPQDFRQKRQAFPWLLQMLSNVIKATQSTPSSSAHGGTASHTGNCVIRDRRKRTSTSRRLHAVIFYIACFDLYNTICIIKTLAITINGILTHISHMVQRTWKKV